MWEASGRSSASASDAAALVAILKTRTRDGPSVAAKIAQSTRHLAGGSVEIKVGQDEEVLSALDLLRAQRAPLTWRLGGSSRRCAQRSRPTTVNREAQ